MSDYVSVEWELPSGVLDRIFDEFCPKTLARCSCVTKAWNDITKDDRFAEKVGLERAWRCGAVVPKCIEFHKSGWTDSCDMRGEMLAMVKGTKIILVNAETGEVFTTTDGATRGSSCLCFIDGLLLCKSSEDFKIMCVLEVPQLEKTSTQELKKIASLRLRFAVDVIVDVGEYVAFAGVGGGVELWSKADWTRAKVLNEGDWVLSQNDVLCATFAKGAALLICGSSIGYLQVWSLTSFARVSTLKGHSGPVEGVAVNENLIISGSMDGTARVWVQETFECVRVISVGTCLWFVALNTTKYAYFSRNSKEVIICGIAGEDRFLHTFRVGGELIGLFLTEDKLTTVKDDGKILVWDFFAHSRSKE